MFQKYEWLIGFAAIVLLALFLHVQIFPYIADTDAFYHLRHAAEYRAEGIFQTEFPWARYSAVRTHAADIWYGFHILLLPFTLFSDLIHGIYWGSFFITAVSLILVFWALKRLEVKWPVFWTLVFAVITADLMYRLTMLRPHSLSLGLALLLFSYLIKSPRTWRGLLPPAVISAVFTWLHLSLAWTIGLVAAAVMTAEFLQKRHFNWRAPIALLGGIVAGWLFRPNPFGALKLAYIQVVELMAIKSRDLPLRFGRELSPFVWENFADQLFPITALLLIAAGAIFVARRIAYDGILASGSLAAVFFAMTFAVARRSNELFVGFAVIFMALAFTAVYSQKVRRSAGWSLAVLASIIALIFAPVKNVYRFGTYIANAHPPFLMRGAGKWLSENARPGEVVFHPHWDRFGELFFWNPENIYINGMDPVFQYVYDPHLYWESHFYAIDQASAYTCREIRCAAAETRDTYKAMKEDFQASYMVLEKRRNPSLIKYLDGAPLFRKSFEDQNVVVYKIL